MLIITRDLNRAEVNDRPVDGQSRPRPSPQARQIPLSPPENDRFRQESVVFN